ncbi:MAG TPA: class I SAM-dependent methyltransferase [Candidatus Binataceae bacterium]|nr:class I SAM-dependent methyltransferase [Candidatus Binataceae bacterium]
MSNSDQEDATEVGSPGDASASRTRVAKYFGRLASVYGEGEYYRNRRAAVVASIKPELTRAKSILDLGSGPGVYTSDFREIARDTQLVAADLTHEMLLAVGRRELTDVRLVQCDASELPFESGTWQLIFSSHVLPFISDLNRCVAEIARSLARGGMLIAAFGSSGIRDQLRDRIDSKQWRRFSEIVFGARRLRHDDGSEQRYREAYEAAGLTAELRNARFAVSWPGIEEWIRLRWLTLTNESERFEAEQILKSVRPPDSASATLQFHEPLLIGRKA